MPKMIFVNLPVNDLATSVKFYTAIGCEKNAQFSDEKAASMVWSETISFQLLSRDYFATFTSKPVANAREASGVLLALLCDTREAVDVMTEAAAAAGGKADVQPPQDQAFMYLRTFEDPDGHIFEPMWMSMSEQTDSR